ncbi:MAG: hypothetical protein FWG40_01395 [Peptococcaceae bacterium]|nr:hypothetical protein [Peptococcaceae bacterium]
MKQLATTLKTSVKSFMPEKLPLSVPAILILLAFSLVCVFLLLQNRLIYVTATEGVVTHEIPVTLLIANTETLVISPAGGTPVYLKPDGSRFRRDEKIADIGKDILTAPVSGLFFAGKDDLEGILTPTTLTTMDLQKLMTEVNSVIPETTKLTKTPNPAKDLVAMNKFHPITGTSASGVAGKMVNNLESSWAFIYLTDAGNIPEQGDLLHFKVEEDTIEKAYVERLSYAPRGAVVRFHRFLESSGNQRVLSAQWIRQNPRQGIVVPVSAVFYKGSETSVYVVESGIILQKSVRVIDQNKDFACIEGIYAETRVVKNPRAGINGKKVQSP